MLCLFYGWIFQTQIGNIIVEWDSELLANSFCLSIFFSCSLFMEVRNACFSYCSLFCFVWFVHWILLCHLSLIYSHNSPYLWHGTRHKSVITQFRNKITYKCLTQLNYLAASTEIISLQYSTILYCTVLC